jgi:hypothetical protein
VNDKDTTILFAKTVSSKTALALQQRLRSRWQQHRYLRESRTKATTQPMHEVDPNERDTHTAATRSLRK